MAQASVTDPVRTPASTLDPWPVRCGVVALLVGIGLRLTQWVHARPLWLDEAMLSVNILGRSYRGLTAPLASDQTAPVPFLWSVKLASSLSGSGEMTLRLPALLAGIAALLLIWLVARRLLQPWAAVLAVGLAALSPELIYYSNEVKPYGLDAAFAAGMALLTLRLLDRPTSRPRWAALLAAGLATALASTPAPFVLSGVGLALLADPVTRTTRETRWWLPACALLWAAAFILVYLAVYRDAAGNAYMQRFWLDFFLDPHAPGLAARARSVFGLTFRDLLLGAGGGWRETAALGYLAAAAIGLGGLVRRRPAVACLLAIPLFAALAASAFSRYPAAPRLLLFAGPGLILLTVAGLARAAQLLGGKHQGALLGLAGGAVLLLPARDAVMQARTPLEREAARPLITWFLQEHQPGAAVYLPGRTIPAWLYYTTEWNAPDTARLRRLAQAVSSTGPLFYQRPTRGGAVVNEGDEFVSAYRDWQELIGVPPGRGPDSTGRRRVGNDPGWAENEVRRFHALKTSELWLIATTYELSEPDPLGPAIVAAGARETARKTVAGGYAARFDLTGLRSQTHSADPAVSPGRHSPVGVDPVGEPAESGNWKLSNRLWVVSTRSISVPPCCCTAVSSRPGMAARYELSRTHARGRPAARRRAASFSAQPLSGNSLPEPVVVGPCPVGTPISSDQSR